MHVRPSYLLAFSFLAAACQEAAVCEEGSVDSNGTCVAPPAAAVQQVRLTHLDVAYDLSKPVYVNNRVPITFGITANSDDPANSGPRNVAVTFSFVEANPSDPQNPLACSSSAINVEVIGDGTEQIVEAYIWPTTQCAALAAKNAEVNLQVDFDGGPELAAEIGSDLDAPSVVFSEARRGDALNQHCRASLNAADPKPGCVHPIRLQPTPTGAEGTLTDVRYALSSSSSVAVLSRQPTEDIGPDGPPDVDPAIIVQSRFVINGRDPYISAVDPSQIPPSLLEAVPSIEEDLKFGLDDAALAALSAPPGKATVSYTIQSAADGMTKLPLTIRDPANPKSRVPEVVVDRIVPGTANDAVHELYLEGAALEAVSPGGAWANQSDFVIRGCFTGEFAQGGNEGDGDLDDCRELEVVLVREASSSSAASSRSFDKEFERKLGNDRIAIESRMSTQNRLDLSGAFSRTEGEVALKGKIGKSFDLTMARAFADASLAVDPTKTSYEVGVDAFGQRIFGVSEQAASIVQTEDFSAAKSFTIGSLGFGFGPVTVGFKIGVGGSIGIALEDTLEALSDSAACQDLLKSAEPITACGRMTRITSPNFGLTGTVEGGVDLKIVKAAVVADLRFITTSFPLDTTLGFGLTGNEKLLVRGDVTWDMSFTPLEGDVSIVGKVGFRRFAKSLKVHLFSFSSPTFETRLLSASMGTPEELQ
ncbi:hypothetical protein [Polyangium fumosum]|uniref:Uncharacterized protein n=1 Tax=Polyangium fumosum TaxID=889272 RepID=A0A4U1IXH7_9BACT|nr:hypothetical protein [Polyangium fumosum]TKC99310.1 hypothetical protein E8A74_38495 [Polyangium fumosum]